MSDIVIHRVKINAKKFRALPDQERHFVIIMGHALNELNFISRCIFASGNELFQDSNLERNIMWCQNLFFLRLHLSKCHEIWQVYKKYRAALAVHEKSILQDDTIRASRKFLSDYFSKCNIATTVRKGFGFHYPTKYVPQFPLRQFDDNDEFEIFLHETRMNSQFFMCDFLCCRMMEKEIFGNVEDDKLQEHLDKMLEEDGIMTEHTLGFFDNLLGRILETGLSIDMEKAEKITLTNVPKRSQLKLSFFLDPVVEED